VHEFGETQRVGLRYFQPARELRDLVSSYYLFHALMPRVQDSTRADFAQIRFMLAGRGDYTFADGEASRTATVSLVGPTMAPVRFAVDGPLIVFGISLMPAGWAALVRDDASRYADSAEDATAVFGSLLEEALDAMRCAHSAGRMVAIANALMRALAGRARETPLWFTRLTDSWLMGASSPRVDELVAASSMSARQIERLAGRIYGAPPKLLARKYRALRSASLLGSGMVSWQEAAGDAYYDQSHFIREIKQFTGLTPSRLIQNASPVTRLTLRRRELLGKMSPLALIS
jgi:AraC-like DNA-binding protein